MYRTPCIIVKVSLAEAMRNEMATMLLNFDEATLCEQPIK